MIKKNIKYIIEYAFVGSKRLYDDRTCRYIYIVVGRTVLFTTFRAGEHEDCIPTLRKSFFFFIIVFFVHIFFYNFPLTHSVNTYNNSYKYILYRRPHHRKVQQRIVSAGDKFEYLRLHYIVVRYAFSFFLLYAYNNIYSLDDTLKATSSAFLLNCFQRT